MKEILTSKGQITIPQAIRERLNPKPGDVLDFDEDASVIVARRVIAPEEWSARLDQVRETWDSDLITDGQTSGDFIEELRGPMELPSDGGGRGET